VTRWFAPLGSAAFWQVLTIGLVITAQVLLLLGIFFWKRLLRCNVILSETLGT
jgi:hypothetical protein